MPWDLCLSARHTAGGVKLIQGVQQPPRAQLCLEISSRIFLKTGCSCSLGLGSTAGSEGTEFCIQNTTLEFLSLDPEKEESLTHSPSYKGAADYLKDELLSLGLFPGLAGQVERTPMNIHPVTHGVDCLTLFSHLMLRTTL